MSRSKGRKSPSDRSVDRRETIGEVFLTSQGMPSSSLCALAEDRVGEASLLLTNEYYTGAAYIAGYAIELYLKAIIARKSYADIWPLQFIAADLRTHNLEVLLTNAGLNKRMRAASATNFELASNWQALRDWGPDLRYRRVRRALATDIVLAVTDKRYGVAVWLRLHHEGG